MIYAGFWIRFAAMIVDVIIMFIPAIAINAAIPYVGSFLCSVMYYPIFEASPLKATPGKIIMGLSVVNATGGQVTFKQAFIRYFMKTVSALILGIGYLMNLFTEKKQTLHDMAAEVYVVKAAAPKDLNYFDTWVDTIKNLFAVLSNDNKQVYNQTSDNKTSIQSLEELHRLFQSGVITQQDYDAKKAELLKKI